MGGYHIINLLNKSITTAAQITVPGIYNSIEGSYRKPILLTNVVIAGVEKPDAFVAPIVADSAFVFTCYGVTFSIDADDHVSIS